MQQKIFQEAKFRRLAVRTGRAGGQVDRYHPELAEARLDVAPLGVELAALEAEARTAKALALKAAKAVETIEINSLEGITQAQTYRSNLWPSVSPSIKPALEAAQRGERLVVSEETKKYVEQLKTLM